MRSRFVQPALIGGLVLGSLSALPLISAGNACCCLWIVLGGVVAAYFLQQQGSAPLSTGDGALAGLAAGVVGALVYLVLSIPITIVLAPVQRAIFERLARSSEGMPPAWRQMLESPVGNAVGIVLGFVMMLFVAPIFSTLGGVLGAALFRKPPRVNLPDASGPGPAPY